VQIKKIIYNFLGYQNTYNTGFNKGKQKGYDEGFKDGFSEGLSKGESTGIEKGKKIIIFKEIKPKKDLAVIEKENQYIITNYKFKIAEKKEKIISALNKKIFTDSNKPTPDQWKLILTDNPNTYVIAGAGSGKSTTLIYRILIMNKFLNIPLSHITIFSFTRKSTVEFREKLKQAYSKFDIELKDSDVKKVVRTFHSKIYQFAQNMGVNNLFEFLDEPEEDSDFNIGIKLGDKQKELLKEVYENIYKNNSNFKKIILELFRITITRPVNDDKKDYGEYAIKKNIEVDKEITEKTHKYFEYKLKYEELVKFQLNNISSYNFYANLYYKELDIYIVFCPYVEALVNDKLEDGRTIADRLTIKRRYLNAKSDKNLKIIYTQEDLNKLEELIRIYNDSLKNSTVPIFDYKSEGEILSVPIFEAFYATGQFVENIGLEVKNLTHEIIAKSNLSIQDKYFAKTFVMFWDAFEKKLENLKIKRFHNFFRYFSEDNLDNFQYAEDILNSMHHILIDEFQDISPEIVKWIRGCLKYLKNNNIEASLLCVGDDWQSIYGWRGSNPDFLINYKKYFPSNPEPEEIKMTENFRCYQELIDNAEHVLKDVKNKTNKHGISKLNKNFKEPILELISINIDNKESEKDVAKNIINEKYKKNNEKLFVMARTNEKYREIEKEHRKNALIDCFSYHRSKGLESINCLLIGDCFYNSKNPFKNLIYQLADLPQSYDKAQKDESMRLAYVALTRGIKKVIWVGEEKDGGAMTKIKERLSL
jgi:superfamily I DNA/RNA helicase